MADIWDNLNEEASSLLDMWTYQLRTSEVIKPCQSPIEQAFFVGFAFAWLDR